MFRMRLNFYKQKKNSIFDTWYETIFIMKMKELATDKVEIPRFLKLDQVDRCIIIFYKITSVRILSNLSLVQLCSSL